jgi:hypothetical protein
MQEPTPGNTLEAHQAASNLPESEFKDRVYEECSFWDANIGIKGFEPNVRIKQLSEKFTSDQQQIQILNIFANTYFGLMQDKTSAIEYLRELFPSQQTAIIIIKILAVSYYEYKKNNPNPDSSRLGEYTNEHRAWEFAIKVFACLEPSELFDALAIHYIQDIPGSMTDHALAIFSVSGYLCRYLHSDYSYKKFNIKKFAKELFALEQFVPRDIIMLPRAHRPSLLRILAHEFFRKTGYNSSLRGLLSSSLRIISLMQTFLEYRELIINEFIMPWASICGNQEKRSKVSLALFPDNPNLINNVIADVNAGKRKLAQAFLCALRRNNLFFPGGQSMRRDFCVNFLGHEFQSHPVLRSSATSAGNIGGVGAGAGGGAGGGGADAPAPNVLFNSGNSVAASAAGMNP